MRILTTFIINKQTKIHMKHKFLFLMTALFASSVWAQVPKADLLDVVFNEDGTATDVSTSQMTVESFGSPTIVKSAKYGINVMCMKNESWSKNPNSYFRVDYEDNADYVAALADGHTLECLVRPYWDGDLADVECKPFSSHQGGGTGFLICKKSGSRGNEFTFLPNVTETGSSTWRWANSGVVPQKGVYYHVVGVYDKANAVAKIYVNGELKNTIPAPGEYKLASAGNNKFIIGGDPGPIDKVQGLGTTSWQGDVAMARVYSEPLTDEQVAAVYESVKAMDTGSVDHRDFEGADGKWTFENTDNLLKPTEGILQLQPISVGTKSVTLCETLDEVGIVAAEGPTAENKAVFVPKNAGFILKRTDDAAATTSYTIMMDIKMEDAVNFNGLFQTNRNNTNDGDLFINKNQIGMNAMGGYFGEIKDNTWYRIALTNSEGAVKVYVNGEKVINKETTDGRWEIDPWGFYLFCDEDEEMVDTYVAEVTFWETPLTDEEISALGGFNEEEELQKNEEGIYEIGTANQFAQFASIVNGGESDAKAVLMADVDLSGIDFTPIGNKANLYTGTFDGQGHVISNLTVTKGVDADASMGNVADGYVGLFGAVTGGATIKNFTLKNAKLSGSAFIGVIGGSYGSGLVTVDAVGFEGEAIGEQQNVSGIIGVNMGSSASFKISNCYVTGKIAGGKESAAITGWTGGGQSSITNCWSTAEVSGNDAGKAFYRNDDTVWSNCFNQYGEQVNGIPEGSLADGSMTFLLNGNQADGVWYQTLGVDEYPVLTPTSKKVYAVPSEGFRCDGLPLGDIVYTNDEQTPEIPAHEYEGFVCKNCGHVNPDFVQPQDGVYSLGTAEELAWFAKKVNDGDKALNAVLTADIDMSAYPGTEYTIGLNNDGYAGTFDGQFHTVKVAYVNNAEGGTEVNHSTALFRFVNGGTIKNIITTGTIDSNQKFASGLVGKSQGAGATMENVATYVTINSGVNGDGTHAGFLGVADAPATITNAISAIVINGESTNSCGGLSGWASQPVTFNNCLMIGEINCQDNGSATFSRNPGGNTYNNCYYKDGVKELQDNGSATKVTSDQLASGEVCYLLNGDQSEKVFFQTLGQDAYPVLDNTHGVVYKVGETTYSNAESSPTDLPLMSSADAIYVYTIKNCRSGKYVNYAGDSRMTQTSDMNENSYFYFVSAGETQGNFTPVKIYNVAAGKAINGFESWGTGATWYLSRDLNIYTNGLAIGLNDKVGNTSFWWNDYAGGGEFISSWNANGDGGSVFAIEPVEAPAGMVTYVVDYKIDGKVVATAPVATTRTDYEPAAPLYSEVSSCESDGNKITANVVVNAPFKASTEDAPVWYYLKQREIENYKHFAFYTDSETNLSSEFEGAKSMFAFVGDPINGYDIINYAAGKGQYWVIEGSADNGSTPVWSATARKWDLAKKDDTYFGFGVGGFFMNNYGGGDSRTLKLWQSGPTGDNGSTLSVEEVPAEDLAAVEVGFDWDPAPIELTGDYEIVSSLSAINGTSTAGAFSLVGTPKVTVKNFNTNEEIPATITATGDVLTLSLSKAIADHAVVYITIPAGSIADVWGKTNSKPVHLTYFVGYNSSDEAAQDAKLYLTDGIEGIMASGNGVDVFSLSGAQVKKGATASDLKNLKGVYIVNGKKVLLK